MNHPHHNHKSTDSLQESLLPAGKETEAEIVFSPQTKKSETGPSAKIGQADLGGPGHPVGDVEEEGMIMGPSHPIFARDQQQQTAQNPTHPFYPDLQVPPGARFDPISSVGPGFYSPGDPDFDELLPPGPGSNPLGSTIKPPRKPKEHSSSGSLGGHPFGAPPGPGNPPFFM